MTSTQAPAATAAIHGVARVDRRTKRLIPRLKPGEIAVIDHRDLDGLSASGLVERRPAAVINASPSISGRYPNRGPTVLLKAGIPLVDVNDGAIMTAIADAQRLELSADEVRCGSVVFPATWLTASHVEAALESAREFLGVEIEAFARNTLQYIERERHLVVDNLEIPDLETALANRHAVIVVRGEGYKQDLEAIIPYIREVRPVLIAVDGGADALLEFDLKPHLIVGDMDSVSDAALHSGAEIVVHSYPRPAASVADGFGGVDGADGSLGTGGTGSPPSPEPADSAIPSEQVQGRGAGRENGRESGHENGHQKDGSDAAPLPAQNGAAVPAARESAPGLRRLDQLGLAGKVFSVAGTSEDMAMLIAYEKGASLIVTVGTHFGLVDFLDKGRAGMASTFLVRLRVASRLVDARGVSALYQRSAGLGYLAYLFVAAAVPLAALTALSPGLRASLSLAYLVFTNWMKRHGI